MQMFLASFKKDQQGVVTQVKEIRLPPIKDSKDKKVTADKPNILDLDVANAIDGALSATLNNKFAVVSQNLEKMLVTHMSKMESKFSKFFGNNIHASTSNIEKKISSVGDDTLNLQIPKFPPPPEFLLENIHSRTIVGNSAGVGDFVPPYYASAYSTPPPQTTIIPYGPMPNNAFDSSLRYAYEAPNQPPHVPHGSPQPNQAPIRPRAKLEGFREEMIHMFRQTFGIDPKVKMRYPESYEYVQFPQGIKISEFTKFTGNDNRTTLEHVGQFVIQCGEVNSSDIYKLDCFLYLFRVLHLLGLFHCHPVLFIIGLI
jgi:hypothetical protein